VADRCQGKAAPFISLQRWVLSAYLAEICSYANQRLELMTSGRYQLRLTDEGGRGGRQAGLGLRVLDAYTGEEREVSSLSGGETFQASLALALGVADTVEAHSGGVHLEALFIDEGFGTLDPDNLQLAMDELDRLREGGRMVGLISHVGALKERIRYGIEVLSSDQGSRVQVGTNALA
jgi:exonuclease SbcC